MATTMFQRAVESLVHRFPRATMAVLMALFAAMSVFMFILSVRDARLILGPLDGTVSARYIVRWRVPTCRVSVLTATGTREVQLDTDGCPLLSPGLHVSKDAWSVALHAGGGTITIRWVPFFIEGFLGCVFLSLALGGMVIFPRVGYR